MRDAFQLAFGDPTKELLPASMSLYKFNGFNALGRGTITDATELSPWWSPTYGFKHDAGQAHWVVYRHIYVYHHVYSNHRCRHHGYWYAGFWNPGCWF